MSKWLNTRGYSKLSIAICDRCRMKVPYSILISDGNSPGLKVCPPSYKNGCWDRLDPWKLPTRQPESITLQYARPDRNIDTTEDDSLADELDPQSPL